jgi:hypothetical protein
VFVRGRRAFFVTHRSGDRERSGGGHEKDDEEQTCVLRHVSCHCQALFQPIHLEVVESPKKRYAAVILEVQIWTSDLLARPRRWGFVMSHLGAAKPIYRSDTRLGIR